MTSTSARANPGVLQQVLLFPRELRDHWFVIASLVKREIKGRYLNSAVGGLWTVINPLFMLLVYTTVFSVILDIRFELRGVPPETGFAVMVYCAMIPWLAFAESLQRSTNIVLENSNLIKKVAFPSQCLPIYVVLYTLVNEVIGLVLLLIAMPILGWPFPYLFVLYPAVVLSRLVFTLGLCYIFAALNVFIRDVGQIMGLVLMLWMFLTPVFYPPSYVEDKGTIARLMELNPWYHLVGMYRDLFRNQVPQFRDFALVMGVGLVTLAVGYVFFMRSKHRFADEI